MPGILWLHNIVDFYLMKCRQQKMHVSGIIQSYVTYRGYMLDTYRGYIC